MLHLQRASAGSGKTFMLAKTFIRNFLAKKDKTGKYVLRQQIGDSHSEILAITFTNKATNEMKQRIVDKLADLAGITNKPAEKTDYLHEFMQEFGVDEQCIRNQAMKGMKALLHSYSFFQVSTIDSFFQMILRTFANDIDLNDNYQIELNDSYVAQMGVDATLTTVNDEKSTNNKKIIHWLNKIIAEKLQKGQSWNPFNKNNAARGGVYNDLISFTKILYKESFKVIQDDLFQYFDNDTDIFEVIKYMNEHCNSLVAEPRDKCIDTAKEIEKVLESCGEDSSSCYKGFSSLLKHVIAAEDLSAISKSVSSTNTLKFLNDELPIFLKSKDKNNRLTNLMPQLSGLASFMIEQAEEWVKTAKLSSINTSKLHYLGILKEILNNIKEFRDENNLILLSDTNQFLKKIIGRDDAPFIYERIGTFINHYLIDEFQDTSQLQWDNLRPLLLESISKNYDNLIIGDVKQSIYRFRNAEPDLIDRKVPEDYALDVRLCGTTPTENMNWRSAREIVEFNNMFFKHLATFIDKEMPSCRPLAEMYGNVEQEIRHKDKCGYVELNICAENSYNKMGELISDILSRGYQQKDIAFLIDKNKDANNLIEALFEYNKTLPQEKKINFISEESLCISESYAVKIITSILHSISNNAIKSENDNNETDFVDFSRLYHYFMAKNPDTEAAEAIDIVLNNKYDELPINQMLANMHTTALPALVETIAKEFVPEDILNRDSCYMAAFQDIIIDYCEKFPTDVPSFLKWWDNTGSNISISSPEGTNAVSIMTIHKSKGLEFDCVILPSCKWGFKPNTYFPETLWVKPIIDNIPKDFDSTLIPPYIPVNATRKLINTPYEDAYNNYLDNVKVDMLNKTYVAFTRAKKELYVFSAVDNHFDNKENSIKTVDNMGFYINKVVKDNHIYSKYDFNKENQSIKIEYGKPSHPDDSDKNEAKTNSLKRITDYRINTSFDLLKFKSDKDDSIFNEEEDPDPRSEGNLLHLIMSNVTTPSDLHKAVVGVMVKGLINTQQAEQYERRLKTMIENTEMTKWFANPLKVINERPILASNISTNYRPDRVVIMPNKEIAVIDYKFGTLKLKRYSSQIKNYVNLLKNIEEFTDYSIKGYLCFLSIPEKPEIIEQ